MELQREDGSIVQVIDVTLVLDALRRSMGNRYSTINELTDANPTISIQDLIGILTQYGFNG